MEFFYEEESLNKTKDQYTNDKEVGAKNDNSLDTNTEGSYLKKQERINKIFYRFEYKIGNVYEKTANKLKKIVGDVNYEGLTIQIPLNDEEISSRAQNIL